MFGQWVMRNIAFDVVAYGEASDQDWVTQKIDQSFYDVRLHQIRNFLITRSCDPMGTLLKDVKKVTTLHA
jgi:hypothetical protein